MFKAIFGILEAIAFIVSIVVGVRILLWLVDYHLGIPSVPDNHIVAFYDASIVILTIALALIAWIQLHGIIKTGQANFLLEIDKRFSDPSIFEAKKIIHFLYEESRMNNPMNTEAQHCAVIAKRINELGEGVGDTPEERRKNMIDYIYLLNFLDFLETISLFTNKNNISINDVNDLMDRSLGFFYNIFKVRISERRKKYKDNSFYKEFEKLIKKINCKKNRKWSFCYKCYFNYH